MTKICLLTIYLAFALFATGCSQQPDAEVQQPPAEEIAVPLESITDAMIALEEGKRLLDENQTARAIEYLEHAATLNPALAEAHFQLGIAYALLELQNQQDGVVVEPEPANSKEKETKSRSEKAFELAVEAYEKWIDANPKDDVAYYNLGRTYSKLMKDEEAEKAFEQAVKIKPEDTEYQTELGAIRIKLARYHEAIGPLKKAIELDAENVRAEELLEDAQAGRQRIDYVSKPEANKPASNKVANSNSEADSSSNTNSAQRPANANTKPRPDPTRKPSPTANRP